MCRVLPSFLRQEVSGALAQGSLLGGRKRSPVLWGLCTEEA